MPGRDGKGSRSRPQGPGGATGPGRGRGGGRGIGPGGECLCPQCGAKIPHQLGTPCNATPCPKCGATMIRA